MIFKEIAELEPGDRSRLINLIHETWSAEQTLRAAASGIHPDHAHLKGIYIGRADKLQTTMEDAAEVIKYDTPMIWNVERARLKKGTNDSEA